MVVSTIDKDTDYILEVALYDDEGELLTGQSVSYIIYNSNDTIVTTGALSEVGSSGLYKATYGFTAEGQYRIKYTISGYEDSYESVLVQENVEDINNIQSDVTAIKASVDTMLPIIRNSNQLLKGRWKIYNRQMIFYDDDNITPILTVNLYDRNGNPTNENPWERVPV